MNVQEWVMENIEIVRLDYEDEYIRYKHKKDAKKFLKFIWDTEGVMQPGGINFFYVWSDKGREWRILKSEKVKIALMILVFPDFIPISTENLPQIR